MTSNSSALVMYARPPVAGKVKTRLQPEFTESEALALYEAMLADGIERMLSMTSGFATPFVSWSDEAPPSADLSALLGRVQVEYQMGDDLGERMATTLQNRLRGGFKQAIIIGSDSPNLPMDYVDQAFEALAAVDIVLGPSDDGGYYLIGARRLHPRLFQKVPWGTGQVLSITRERIKSGRVMCHELPTWYDVDTPESVRRLWTDLRHMKAKKSDELPARTFQLLAYMASAGRL